MIHRRFWVLVASTAAAFGAWKYGPGTDLDRMAFTTVAGGFANPPLFVSGRGDTASPWKLQVFSSESRPDRKQAPAVVSLGDDLDGFFQKSPPAPIDMAVIFTNFKRLGKTKAASAAVLAWEAPDPIGLAALEKSLGGFESLVMAAPLSRGAVSSAMPPAFRRASIPLTAIQGDTSALPVVNRVPIPGVVLGGGKAVAGFSVLESEAPAGSYPLVARWEDRVVFAFPLLTVLQRLNLSTDHVEIRLGQYLKLGPSGPIVRIDGYGRMTMPLKAIPAQAEIPAEAMIDGGGDLIPEQAPDPLILRDDQSAAELATRVFSRNLTTLITAIACGEGLGHAEEYPRLGKEWELGILSFFVVALTILCGVSWRQYVFILLAAVGLSAQWIGFGTASIWLPGLPVLVAIGATFVVTMLIRIRIPEPLTVVSSALPEIEIPPKPVGPTPAVKKVPARKSTKAPAKTTAKPPAKKAPKKTVPKRPPTPKVLGAKKKPPSKN